MIFNDMSDEFKFGFFVLDVMSEFPDFKIVFKRQSRLMKFINVLLMIITFGQMKTFMTSFVTTIGNTVYVSDGWEFRTDISKMITLRHERIHMRQSKKYGRFLFSLMYLLLPIPIFFAYYRRKFEQEAYEESMKAIFEYKGVKLLLDPGFKESLISHFTSSSYFWMWVKRSTIEEWYDKTVSGLMTRH